MALLRRNPYEFPGGYGRHIPVKTNLFDMEIDIFKTVGQFEIISIPVCENANKKNFVPARRIFELFLHFYGEHLVNYELIQGYPTKFGLTVYTVPPYPYNDLAQKNGFIDGKEYYISGELRGEVKMDDWKNFDNELKKFLKRVAFQYIARMFVNHDFTLMQKSIYSFKAEDTVMPVKRLNNIFQLISGFNLGFETTVPDENQLLSRNMVSINLTQTVVTRANISLIDCYLELCSLAYNEEVATPDELLGSQLDSGNVKLLTTVFKNVDVNIPGEDRLFKLVEVFHCAASRCKHQNGQPLNQYYERKLRRNIRYPDINAVKLRAQKGKFFCIPMELVTLSDKPQKIAIAALSILTEFKQRVKSLTAVVPERRWRFIENIAGMLHADMLDVDEPNLLKNIGIQINDIPIVVDARVLDEPWDTYSKQPQTFAKPYQHPVEYVIIDLCTSGNDKDAVVQDVSNLMSRLYHLGIYILNEQPLRYFAPVLNDSLPDSLKDITAWHCSEAIRKTANKILYIVVVDGSSYHYTSVKYEFDGNGLTSQCITPNILRSIQPSYRLQTGDPKETVIFNIALKINSKLGGVNCRPVTNDPLNLWQEYINDNELTMFIGIDTRLSNQRRKLGLVAITVSIDNTASRYNAYAVMTDGIQKYCGNYIEILYQAFNSYEGACGRAGQFPKRIMIFRAGMNEYEAVVGEGNLEISHIKAVIDQYMKDKNYFCEPKITYIAYHRTHNVRFYDMSKEASTQSLGSDNDIEGCKWNCSPGTVIDSKITNPNCFYLISHETFLGTTKPAKYTIVRDEIEFKADNLLAIVYQLCRLMPQTSRPFRRPVPIGLAGKLLTRCVDVQPKIFNEYKRNQQFFIHDEFRDKPYFA